MDKEERKSPKKKEVKYNSQGKRVKQLSILLYIGVLFVVAVTASMISLVVMSREYRFKYAATQSGEAAENACHMAHLILKYEDPDFEILDNADKRDEIHAFFDSHKEFYVYIPGHILTYTVVSAYIYDDRHILNSFDFSKKEDKNEYIDSILDPKSMVKNVRSDIKVTRKSKILTLSTCTSVSSQRYLVQGVLTDDQLTK